MTVAELQWLVGVSITTVLAIAGIAVGAYRSMASRMDQGFNRMRDEIRDGDRDIAGAMKREDDKLHERVNRVRDEYVPRRELDDHLKRIDVTLSEIRADQKEALKHITALTARAD